MTTIEEWNQIYAGYGLPFNQELHDRIRQEAASQLSALQKENDLLRQHVVSESWQATIDERDSLRTQNRELREAIESAANGLSAIYSEPRRYIEMQLRVRDNLNKALALQPEK